MELDYMTAGTPASVQTTLERKMHQIRSKESAWRILKLPWKPVPILVEVRYIFSSLVSPVATYRQSAKSGNCFHFCYSDNLLLFSLIHSFRFVNLYSELLTSISRDSRFIRAQVHSFTLWIYWFLNSLSPGKFQNYSAILHRSVFNDTLQRNFIDLELYLMTKLKIHNTICLRPLVAFDDLDIESFFLHSTPMDL